MSELHGGRRDQLEVYPNLWAGVGLVRGGAGTALVGDPDTVAERIDEYRRAGADTFIFSGYPHLEEAYRVAELLLPRLPLKHPVAARDGLVNTGPFGEILSQARRGTSAGVSIVSSTSPVVAIIGGGFSGAAVAPICWRPRAGAHPHL